LFLGAAPISDLTSNGLRLLDRTIEWVVNTNAPPLLSWIAPTNGSIFIGSTNIDVSADVSDNDSGLSRIGFYRDGVRVELPNTLTNDTYGLTWSNVPAGTFLLATKAIDQGGLSSTSAVAVTVLSNALFITGSPTLNSSETNLKARIESLGFIVTPKAATNVSTGDALGKTVVLVTHDIREAALLGTTITLMTAGRIVQQGTFADLVDRPATPFVTQFLTAQTLAAGAQKDR